MHYDIYLFGLSFHLSHSLMLTLRLLSRSLWIILIVWIVWRYYRRHFRRFTMNIDIHTCHLGTIKFDQRETKSRFLHWHVIYLYPGRQTGIKKRFVTEIYDRKCWHSLSIWNFSGQLAQFERNHFGYFHIDYNAKSVFVFILSRVLKSDKIEGVFQRIF